MTPEQTKTFHMMLLRLLEQAVETYKAWVQATFNQRNR